MTAEEKVRAVYVIARRVAAQEPGITIDRLRDRSIQLMADPTFARIAYTALDYAEELQQGLVDWEVPS